MGASVAISTLHRGVARELWLDDSRAGLADAEALDLAHGASFFPSCEVRRAGVEDMATGCDVIVIAAGKGALPGVSRLDALAVTAAVAHELGARLRGARGVVVVVTNPVDVMTQLVMQSSGLPPERVIGTGTMLDTARLRHELSVRTSIDRNSLHAYVLGEHGDSQVVAWSTAEVGGLPLRRLPQWRREDEPGIAEIVRRAAYEIIAGKGATNHAIGLVTASLLQCVLRDERRVLTVSRVHEPGTLPTACFGTGRVALSLPTVVSREGAVTVLLPDLDEVEQQALMRSADVLRAAHAGVAAH